MYLSVRSCLLKVICNLLAVDGVNDPDVLAINAGELNSSRPCFPQSDRVLGPQLKQYFLLLKLLLL